MFTVIDPKSYLNVIKQQCTVQYNSEANYPFMIENPVMMIFKKYYLCTF